MIALIKPGDPDRTGHALVCVGARLGSDADGS